MTGTRKPSVLPVPVFAWAMLHYVSLRRFDALCAGDPYTSTPLRASLMVLCWTSVIVSIFICLVMVLMRLGCTRPRVASSEKVVAGPSSAMACSASTSCAICCHLALWWKPATDALAMREDGILSAADVRVRGVRRMLEETATLEMLLDKVAGHLLNAPNMMDGVDAEVRRGSARFGGYRRTNY